ncbi:MULTISPECIES: hypothetical protein [unclassified Streptosporangium]|uniref:hypothetical protein n=1 Tax=unclassified Streptosporangium TaxID=2632669 RepID=UPI002E2B1769|nr:MULTISPECIES: hypothetical protein [unclassified Streptosporangium]
MSNPSVVLDRPTAGEVACGCFADAPPLPMGCADCGHAPYAHGCPGQIADHEYVQPSGVLMAERFSARRQLGLGTLPTFEPAQPTLVPAPRQADPEATPTRTRPAGRTDTRRPATPAARPHRPIETRQDRAARLALARDSLAHRRARTAARTHEHSAPPPSTGQPAARPPLTRLPAPPEHQHQTLRPRPAVALGRGHSPDIPPPLRHQPYRREAAA